MYSTEGQKKQLERKLLDDPHCAGTNFYQKYGDILIRLTRDETIAQLRHVFKQKDLTAQIAVPSRHKKLEVRLEGMHAWILLIIGSVVLNDDGSVSPILFSFADAQVLF